MRATQMFIRVPRRPIVDQQHLPELAPDFDVDPGVFPFVKSPPDVLLLQVQAPQSTSSDPEVEDGCLPEFLANLLVDGIRKRLTEDLGLEDPDVRRVCSRLEVPQPVPGSSEKELRSATTIGAWRDQPRLPGETVARDRALGPVDLIRGFETFFPLLAVRVSASFARTQTVAEVAAQPRRDSCGKENPRGKTVFTGADVTFDEPPDTVVTIVQGFREIAGPDLGFTIVFVERVFQDDTDGKLRCETERGIVFDDPVLAGLLQLFAPNCEDTGAGALCTLTEKVLTPQVPDLGIRLAYVDFSIDQLGVSARAALGGLAINGPSQAVLDRRAPAPVVYSASFLEPPAPFSVAEPVAFEWSVDQGEAEPADGGTTSVTFDLEGESGEVVRHVTVTAKDATGIRHKVTRAARVNAVLIEEPIRIPRVKQGV